MFFSYIGPQNLPPTYIHSEILLTDQRRGKLFILALPNLHTADLRDA